MASIHKASDFDPGRYAPELTAIIREVEDALRLDCRAPPRLEPGVLDRILRRHPRDGRGLFSKSQVIAGFRQLGVRERFAVDEATFLELLRLRPIRTLSGVTPVTVLTRPFPCPGRCVFCPNDVRMPKSYLSDEPGAQRAAANDFDPYLQTWNRMASLRAIGHPVDKVELIVLGGTWSFYPEPYQVWFVKCCFDAISDFGAGVDRRGEAVGARLDYAQLPARVDGRALERSYNQVVSAFLARELGGELLHRCEDAGWPELEAAQRRNERAPSRCVGLVVETRPDQVSRQEVLRIRRLGATKVQLGLQSLSDPVLAANRRGHDLAASREAMRLLRGAGFKIHVHWMPNLLGSSPAQDLEDFERLFADPDFRPDELKIYPCSLIESAELMRHYERGEWRPYSRDELLEVLVRCVVRTPAWCRLTRVIRDISSDDIVAGNKETNFREVVERRLAELGLRGCDIRSREIRGAPVDPRALRLRALEYETGLGRELFLELVAPRDRLAAFLRLSLPAAASGFEEIAGSAVIRELHVYGASLGLGQRAGGKAQHAGLGRRLLREAERRARAEGYARLAVISAVGTREYYRKLGFADGKLYQHRDLA